MSESARQSIAGKSTVIALDLLLRHLVYERLNAKIWIVMLLTIGGASL